MNKTLTEIAQQLKDTNKKVQMIYAFNGVGKTRLSREFKQLIAPKNINDEGGNGAEQAELSRTKILYYNAFTEDLFYWDNDLALDAEPKLKIQPNSFTDWVLKDQGQDQNIITNFQHYANQYLTPHFSEDFTEVTFSLERGDDEGSGNLKISKGEESNFIWSIFYTLLDQVINILNVAEPGDRETNQFDQLEYVFIDDPVSSLDENHLIEQAIESNNIQRYHFMMLRNLYEKTANFLGYPRWSELLPDDKQPYLNRIIQFTSHSTLSNEEIAEPTDPEKQTVKFLLDNLVDNYGFWQQGEQNG